MFGYVRPAADRLTQEQTDLFRSAYCGLCRTLGRRYGLPARMILNYDLAFLAILPTAAAASCARYRAGASHPGLPCRKKTRRWMRRRFQRHPDLVAAAWRRRITASQEPEIPAGRPASPPQLPQGRPPAAGFDRLVQGCLGELAELERENCPSIDRPADTFARLLAGAAGEEPDPTRRRVLAQLLYHLGRWIYLTDAADDLAKDQRSGSYNPLPLRFSVQEGKLTEESRQELAQTMDRSVERMAAAFELLECGVWQPVIESVVYAGLYQVGNAVLNGTFHQRPRREKYPERKAGHGDA
ncbi:MAG: DUF5685 family protein [Oscillospiraceae bacterium]